MLLLSVSGCGVTTMSAVEAASPILLGPVSCIGCSPQPADVVAVEWQTAVSSHRGFSMLMLKDGRSKATGFGRLTGNVCSDDFHLSRLRVGAWVFSIPVLYTVSDLYIEAAVTRAVVRNGRCR